MPLSRLAPASDHLNVRFADLLAHRFGNQYRSRSGRRCQAARQVDRPAEPVPGAADRRPVATPTRSRGRSSSAAATSTKASTASSSAATSGDTNMTASPMVLMKRTGGWATSWASSSSRLASRSSRSGRQFLAQSGEPDEIGKAGADHLGLRSGLPSARSAAFTESVSNVCLSCNSSRSLIIGPSSGAAAPSRTCVPLAMSSSLAPASAPPPSPRHS